MTKKFLFLFIIEILLSCSRNSQVWNTQINGVVISTLTWLDNERILLVGSNFQNQLAIYLINHDGQKLDSMFFDAFVEHPLHLFIKTTNQVYIQDNDKNMFLLNLQEKKLYLLEGSFKALKNQQNQFYSKILSNGKYNINITYLIDTQFTSYNTPAIIVEKVSQARDTIFFSSLFPMPQARPISFIRYNNNYILLAQIKKQHEPLSYYALYQLDLQYEIENISFFYDSLTDKIPVKLLLETTGNYLLLVENINSLHSHNYDIVIRKLNGNFEEVAHIFISTNDNDFATDAMIVNTHVYLIGYHARDNNEILPFILCFNTKSNSLEWERPIQVPTGFTPKKIMFSQNFFYIFGEAHSKKFLLKFSLSGREKNKILLPSHVLTVTDVVTLHNPSTKGDEEILAITHKEKCLFAEKYTISNGKVNSIVNLTMKYDIYPSYAFFDDQFKTSSKEGNIFVVGFYPWYRNNLLHCLNLTYAKNVRNQPITQESFFYHYLPNKPMSFYPTNVLYELEYYQQKLYKTLLVTGIAYMEQLKTFVPAVLSIDAETGGWWYANLIFPYHLPDFIDGQITHDDSLLLLATHHELNSTFLAIVNLNLSNFESRRATLPLPAWFKPKSIIEFHDKYVVAGSKLVEDQQELLTFLLVSKDGNQHHIIPTSYLLMPQTPIFMFPSEDGLLVGTNAVEYAKGNGTFQQAGALLIKLNNDIEELSHVWLKSNDNTFLVLTNMLTTSSKEALLSTISMEQTSVALLLKRKWNQFIYRKDMVKYGSTIHLLKIDNL